MRQNAGVHERCLHGPIGASGGDHGKIVVLGGEVIYIGQLHGYDYPTPATGTPRRTPEVALSTPRRGHPDADV